MSRIRNKKVLCSGFELLSLCIIALILNQPTMSLILVEWLTNEFE